MLFNRLSVDCNSSLVAAPTGMVNEPQYCSMATVDLVLTICCCQMFWLEIDTCPSSSLHDDFHLLMKINSNNILSTVYLEMQLMDICPIHYVKYIKCETSQYKVVIPIILNYSN